MRDSLGKPALKNETQTDKKLSNLSYMPKKVSLIEMEKNQIINYMRNFENLSNFLYIKVWENSGLPYSFYKYYSVHKKSDYFIKESWKEHFKDRCIMPSNQFELGYEFKG